MPASARCGLRSYLPALPHGWPATTGKDWPAMHHPLTPPARRAICDTPLRPNSRRFRSVVVWTIKFIIATLPGTQVCGAAVADDTLYVIVNDDKPNARDHLVDLVQHWPVPYDRDALAVVFFDAGYNLGLATCDDPDGARLPQPEPSCPPPQDVRGRRSRL